MLINLLKICIIEYTVHYLDLDWRRKYNPRPAICPLVVLVALVSTLP